MARECIGCRRVRPKAELARFVVTLDGVTLDRTGRLPGRGAYVCPEEPCLALARRRLAGALRTKRIDFEMIVKGLEAVRS